MGSLAGWKCNAHRPGSICLIAQDMAANPVFANSFELDRFRLETARSLPAQCFDDFQRLTRTLIHGPAFQWLLVDARHELLRQQVMDALDSVLAAAGLRVKHVQLGPGITDVSALETLLVENAAQAEVVHVIGSPGWFDAQRWEAFNVRRERIATNARARLVFWLDADAIALASQGAPDLWAWRSGVYAFAPVRESDRFGNLALAISTQARGIPGVDNRNKTERYRRLGEIRAWLEAHLDAPEDMRIALIDELGQLLFELGDYDAALMHLQQVALPFYQRMGAEREAAITKSKIADILQAHGQLEEALSILREEILPVFERLGIVRERAIAQGKIADILKMQGKFDEALRIWHEEQLPVFERLGDIRERTLTQSRIADVLQTRGRLDEALNIRRKELLPVFERLGDVRSRAVTQSNIADILEMQGQLDKALRIQREEVMPVFERLGDVRSRAMTQSKIADILQELGQFDEVLRIQCKEVIPALELLGDVRSRAICQLKIAKALRAKNPHLVAEALTLLQEARQALKKLGLPEENWVEQELHAIFGMAPPPASAT